LDECPLKEQAIGFACFLPSLSSCHEKATVALYFGRILTDSGIGF